MGKDCKHIKMVVSPAKSLNLVRSVPTQKYSMIEFEKEVGYIHSYLREYTALELSQLMKISMPLAQLNFERNQQFSFPFTTDNARAAMYMFDGDVYSGFDAYSLNKDKIDAMQRSVRILSGLYGLLKPLDLIRPYRLEMGANFSFGRYANLYEFWSPIVTSALQKQLQNEQYIVNLASQEYFKVIDKKQLNKTIISPMFKDRKAEGYKVISFYAKKARGLMARYIIDQNIERIEDIKGFDYQGYKYCESETKNESEPVFVRG